MTRTQIFRAGLRRGLLEYRNVLQTPSEFGYTLVGLGVVVAVVFFLRDAQVEGVDASVMFFAFPGMIAMQIMLAGSYGAATVLSGEREDGTLLRAKSVPNGMAAYVVGLVVRIILEIVVGLLIVVIPVALMVPEVWGVGPAGFAMVLGYLLLGILALVPLGIVLGAAVRNPRSVAGWGLLVAIALVGISGLFAPLEVFPGWLQIVAQIFPLYWVGLAMRSAILPEGLHMVEIGDSWRTVETFGVLGAWALVGLLLAPALLRRAARRETGSALQHRRQEALQRA